MQYQRTPAPISRGPITIFLKALTRTNVFRISAKVTVSLDNVALLKGQTLTYRCNTSIRMDLHYWYFVPLGTRGERIIYNTKGLNGDYVTRAQVDNSSLVLTIPSIQLDDAGIYGCKALRNSTVITEMAQDIVIGRYNFWKSSSPS